jgi:hypothetical protein
MKSIWDWSPSRPSVPVGCITTCVYVPSTIHTGCGHRVMLTLCRSCSSHGCWQLQTKQTDHWHSLLPNVNCCVLIAVSLSPLTHLVSTGG